MDEEYVDLSIELGVQTAPILTPVGRLITKTHAIWCHLGIVLDHFRDPNMYTDWTIFLVTRTLTQKAIDGGVTNDPNFNQVVYWIVRGTNWTFKDHRKCTCRLCQAVLSANYLTEQGLGMIGGRFDG